MKKRSGEPFMSAPDYGRSLRGFGVNLLVSDVARAVAFQTEVQGSSWSIRTRISPCSPTAGPSGCCTPTIPMANIHCWR